MNNTESVDKELFQPKNKRAKSKPEDDKEVLPEVQAAEDFTLSPGAEADVNRDQTAEELRRKEAVEGRAKAAEKEAAKNEEKSQGKSSASVEQYEARLSELSEQSQDQHLSYNQRQEAKNQAFILQAVVNDLKGEGSIAGATVPTEDRPAVQRLPLITEQ